MHIAFDAKRLFNNHTGLGNYSRNLVDNINTFSPEVQVSLFAPKVKDSSFFSKYSPFDIHTYNSPMSSYWRSYGMTKEVNNLNPDVFHGLSNELPLNSHKITAKKIVTVHDLFYERFPKDFTFIDQQIYRYKTKKACDFADVIIAISEATKRDIIEFLNVDEKKIQVVYQTCNSIFQQNSENPSVGNTELPAEFFLYVGTINKRKNLIGIIEAMGGIPIDSRLPLVIVGGGKKDYINQIKARINELGLEKAIFFLGQLDNTELKTLYSKAKFFCLPSFYEGFGIPIIESLFCNTPVLTSDISSLPEAAGDCGILIKPNSIEEIKEGILKLTFDKEYLNKLKNKIPHHLKKYSGHSTNHRLIDIYKLIC